MRTIDRLTVIAAAGVLSATGLAATAFATPGDLDPRFSADGKLFAGFKRHEVRGPVEIVQQPDGRLVALATVEKRERDKRRARGSTPRQNLALVRLNRRGRLDRRFSRDGKAIVALPDREVSAGLALQSDGKIIVAATTRNDFLLLRIKRRGKLDRGFSGDGLASADFGLEDDAEAVAVQADDRIVVVGSAIAPSGSPAGALSRDFALARFEADGRLDAAFSGDGLVTTHLPPSTESASSDADIARDVAISQSGEIVVTGSSSEVDEYASESLFAVARYRRDGSLDPSFDGDGIVKNDFGGGAPLSVALQDNGSILSGGTSSGSFAVARYLTDGQLDTSFAGSGEVEVDAGGDDDAATEVAVDGSLRPLLAGSTEIDGAASDFALLRFTSAGELDDSFSEDGRVIVDLGGGERVEGMVVQPDGKIVLAGPSSGRLAFTRHEVAEGIADFDADGVEDAEDRCPTRFGKRPNGCPRRRR